MKLKDADFTFVFKHKRGGVFIDPNKKDEAYVLWGGLGFQIEAAKPDLRNAIDKAKREYLTKDAKP